MYKKIFAFTVAFVFLSSVLVPAAKAASIKMSSSEETIATVQEIVPFALQETLDEDNVQIAVTHTVEDSVLASAVLDTNSATANQGAIEVLFATSGHEISSDLSTFTSSQAGVSGIVKATPFGFKVVTVIQDASAPDVYDYKLDVPLGTKCEEMSGGYFLDDGKDFSSRIGTPWAFDSQHNPVKTWFTMSDNYVLTQHVDLESVAPEAFPVVADPDWGYSKRHSLSVSTTSAWNAIHREFSRYFPVQGAPRYFPTHFGQLIPLFIEIYLDPLGVVSRRENFECTMGTVEAHNGLYGWTFWATRNHVDGFESWIKFRFLNTSNGPTLAVDTLIVNTYWLGNPFYETMATVNWWVFANNLNSI